MELEAVLNYQFSRARLLLPCVIALFAVPLVAQEYVVPISANSPHVFMSITNERDPDDVNFFSIPQAPPQGDSLPINQDPHYEVAIYDTGSPATIISHDTFQSFDIAGAGRAGINVTPLGGVGETVDAINSDPVGVYAVGFDGLIVRGDDQTISRPALRGTINDSVLYGAPGTTIPNLIGTTTSTHYTSVLDYSAPKIIEWEGETYRSPSVTLTDLGDVDPPDRRIQMIMKNGALGLPSFLPDLAAIVDNIDDLGNNPQTPTIAGSFWLSMNVSNNGATRNRLEAIFDTGAQGSFVSEQIAAEMGFDVINDKPDFVVRIAGVTGVSEEVPGFYADELAIPGTDGGLVLTNVPLIVFNLTDPSSEAQNTLDALIGMNLFAGRDLVLNPEPGGAYLGVSDPVQPFHGWNSTEPTARWGDFTSWDSPGIPAIDWYADVTNKTGTPQITQMQEDTELGMFVTRGHATEAAGTITTELAPGTTMTIFGSAIIEPGATVHFNDATLDPLAVEIRGGQISGSGNVGGEVLSQGTITPGGDNSIGVLSFPGSVDQLDRGTLQVEFGDNSVPAAIQHDKLEVEGAMSVAGRLELGTTDEYIELASGASESITIIEAETNLFGSFDSYSFNGVEMERTYRLPSDPDAFRDHIEDGYFVSITYPSNAVVIETYQATPGDVDGNGLVEFEDFIVLSTNFKNDGDWTFGDFDGDGKVLFADFLALSDNFGDVVRAETSSVPEPNTGMLASLACVVLLGFRRRR